jgi:hypothetical protein
MKRSRTPARSRSYLAVRKAGKAWEVRVITPGPSRPLQTAVARYAVRSAAVEQARYIAAGTDLTFRERPDQ